MFKELIIASMLVLIMSGVSYAQGRFGVGVIIGEPTGISYKSWIDSKTAMDIAAAWSFSDKSAFHIHADYLIHEFGLIEVRPGKLPLYYGIGGRVKLSGGNDGSEIGVRIPVGVSYIFATQPLDAFIEIAPILDLAPATEIDVNGGLGIRFWFK